MDAPDTYHSVSEYRRTLALIDVGDDARYVLDLFRVQGGDQHDYSLHGFEAPFATSGVDLSPPQTRGSLAGEEVPREAVYDDAGLREFRCKGRSYYTYRGGGYSYLYDALRGPAPRPWTATWRDDRMGLRAHLLPSRQAIVAHGDPPRKPGAPKQFTYVLLRNQGDSLGSRFGAGQGEFQREPSVRSVEVLQRTPTTLELRIIHGAGDDVIRHQVDARGTSFSRIRRDSHGRVVRLDQIGVGRAAGDGTSLSVERGLRGRVVSVDAENSTVEIERDRDSQPFSRKALIGCVARFTTGRRTSAYTITSVEGRGRRFRLGFGDDSFRIGRLVIGAAAGDGTGLSTPTYLYLAAQGYYRGARLVDETHQAWLPVEDVKLAPHRPGSRRSGSIRLTERADLAERFRPGEIAYLYDFGPGDAFSVTPQATALRRADGTFRVTGNGRGKVETAGMPG